MINDKDKKEGTSQVEATPDAPEKTKPVNPEAGTTAGTSEVDADPDNPVIGEP